MLAGLQLIIIMTAIYKFNFHIITEVDVRSDVQVARMITDRKRRHYVSLYTGSFIPYQHLELRNLIGEGKTI